MINTVIQGDCLEKLKELADNSIDLTVTSPPYDNLRTYNGYTFNFEGIAKELYRVTKQGGVVVWVVGDATIKGSETGTSFKQALYFKEIGFNLHDTMIWAKDAIPYDPKCNRYWQAFEYMFVFTKGKPTCNYLKEPCKGAGKEKSNDYGQRRTDGTLRLDRIDKDRKVQDIKVKTNVWYYPPYRPRTGHPATFPEKLAEDHILSWSNEGDIILDPMAGSGTTLKMAKKNNRNYIGIEISPEYIEIINNRLK